MGAADTPPSAGGWLIATGEISKAVRVTAASNLITVATHTFIAGQRNGNGACANPKGSIVTQSSGSCAYAKAPAAIRRTGAAR
ncbi:hypothetical protein GCM10009645_17440 [Mycolicibacterium poriferae]|uniref:Uncharacterized protein n=1 Tax=Mycolicibacterium poriferae TaxID=39694 RepID=A0A6N4V913_9MYCO|nr:hypothetical protein MPOR_15990 [Mycolicibacterium poriferae]